MSRSSSSLKGQMTLDFLMLKNQRNEVIKYPDVPRVYLLFDVKDSGRVEKFKHNFTGIEYREFYDKSDYILAFLSMESMKNEEFLEVFLNIDDEVNIRKFVGLIIDDNLRKMERRLELYEYYHNKYVEICDFKKKYGSNADIRRCGDIYERCFERMGSFIEKIIKEEENKIICAEDKFELCLKNDNNNGLRIKYSKKVDDKNVEEENRVETKNEFNNCNIVNTGKDSQFCFNEGKNYSVNQKQGFDKDELEIICEAITKDIQSLNEKEKAQFETKLEELKREFRDSQNTKGSKLTKCLKLIVPMLTIANGTPTLCQNIQNLQSFLMSHIT